MHIMIALGSVLMFALLFLMRPLDSTTHTALIPHQSQPAHIAAPVVVATELPSILNLATVPSYDESTFAATNGHQYDEESVHAYGNTLAGLLRDFENATTDSTETLDSHAKRRDPDASVRVEMLAHAYRMLADAIRKIPSPQETTALNNTIANAYDNAGHSLSAIAASTDDTSFLSAIYEYNGRVNELATAMSSLGMLFYERNVTFRPDEPGAMLIRSNR